MAIRTKCPSCQTIVSVPDSAAGKSARCQSCQQIFKIPAGARPPKPGAASSAPRPAPTGSTGTKPAAKSAPSAAGKTIKCPSCQSVIRLPADSQGKLLACPRCQKQFRVPGPKPSSPAGPVRPQPAARAPAPRAAPPAAAPLDEFDFGDLGESTPLGSSSFSPPTQSFSAGQAYAPPRSFAAPSKKPGGGDRPEVLYIIPGILILLWSLLLIGLGIFRSVGLGIAVFTMEIPAQAIPRLIGFAVGSLLTIVIGAVMAMGSVNMIRRVGLGTARTAAILALIPCFGGCVFPIGIWATVLLYTGPAKRDFHD